MFNASSISDAFGYITGMFSSSLLSIPIGLGLVDYVYIFVLMIGVFILEWSQRSKEYALQFCSSGWIKVLIIYAVIAHLIFCNAAQSDFIYYQF